MKKIFYSKDHISQKRLFCSIIMSLVFFVSTIQFTWADDVDSLHEHSISLQFGVNGVLQKDLTSYGLQIWPPDFSYAYEFYDKNDFSIATCTFFDNIGVNVDDATINYRYGQRFDFGRKIEFFSIYTTLGLALMTNNEAGKTKKILSPIWGFGLLTDISSHYSFVMEANFQHETLNRKGYDIVNISYGITYNF